MPDSGGGGGIIGAILQFITGLFGNDAGNVWGGIAGTSDIAFGSLNSSLGLLGEITGKLKNVFGSIWNQVIKVVLVRILEAYQKLRELLNRIFGPIVRWMERLRKLYDSYFNQFVKPILNIIRQLRKFLQIFKLLGFKWAARLDGDLARIEGKIAAVYTQLRAYLNIATSWLQLIIDPTGILRRNPVLGAIIRSAPELRNLMDAVKVHTETQQEVDKSNRANGWFLPAARAENMNYYKQGKLPPDLEAARQEFLDAYAALPGLANQSLG